MAKHAEIKIDLDARCSRCGAKGAAQNGLCLTCAGDDIVNKIKEERMAKVEVKVQTTKLEVKGKIVEDKEKGEVIDRDIVTSVTLEYIGVPGKLDDVLHTLRAGHAVDVTFSSPQLSLGMETKEEKVPEASTV